MVDLATRFAMFAGVFPSVEFVQFNVDEERISPEKGWDTAFMFSIHDHLSGPERLIQIADRNIRQFVVFEGHPGSHKERYSRFFDSGIFARVRELGSLPESRFNPNRRRPLWICEKR
jgi:hypothetical protein